MKKKTRSVREGEPRTTNRRGLRIALLVALVLFALVAHPGLLIPSGWKEGFLFYLAMWPLGRWLPLWARATLTLALEASWEVLENSPLIIDRYRSTTISLDYYGDSVLNSLSDIAMCAIGFTLEYPLHRYTQRARALATWNDALLDGVVGPGD